MHQLHCQPASADLQPYVRAYAQREFSDPTESVIEALPARLEQTLEFQFGDPFDVANATQRKRTSRMNIVGAYTEGAWMITLKNKVTSFGVFFQPTGLSCLCGIPAHEFSNNAFDASSVLSHGLGQLHDRLAGCPSFRIRVQVMEQFLRGLAAKAPIGKVDVGISAAGRIFEAHGAVRLRELAADYGMSLRQLERRITQGVGITPKVFARVARFQTALDMKLLMPHHSWMAIAHDLGYHDQMHMVHDFHHLAGAAPSEILASIGDARPPAMQTFSQL